MKRKGKILSRIFSIALCIAMIISTLSTLLAQAETEDITEETANTYAEVAEAEGGTVLVGNTLVSEDFSGLETDTEELPEGWVLIQDVDPPTETSEKTDWLTDASKARTEKVDNGLKMYGTTVDSDACDGLLAAPSLGVADYVMTATIESTSGRAGYIGLASNIIDPVSDSVGATCTHIYTTSTGNSAVMRNIWHTGYSVDKKINQQTIDVNKILGSAHIKNKELKLAICSINGRTYFYIDDNYVGVIEQTNPEAEKSLCGFYVYNQNIIIKDVKVQELAVEPKTDITGMDYITERITISSVIPSQINNWAEGANYGSAKLYDGKRTDGYYMSNAYTSAAPEEEVYVDIVLSGRASVTRVDLYTLANGSVAKEFPESITVFAWTGDTWKVVAMGYRQDLQAYDTNTLIGSVAFNTVITDKLRITASTLGIGGDSQYYFNMRELEVYGRSNILHDTDSVYAETETWSSVTYGPSKLIDENIASGNFYTSAYGAEADATKEVTIHFDGTYRLDGVNLFPRLESGSYKCGFPVDFTISVKLKSGEWKQVYQDADVVAVSYGKTLSFYPESCTAVKLSVTKLSPVDDGSAYALQLAEIEALGAKSLVLDADIAAEHPEWATAFMPYKINDGIDGNLYTSTYETTEDEVKTVHITMDKAYSINRIWLTPRVADGVVYGFPIDFTIDLWDGTAWQNVVTETGFITPNATDKVDFCFDSVVCRGLRITVTKLGASDNDGQPYVLQMGEIDVFGTDVEDTDLIYRQGDINADDAVNEVDLQLLIQQLLGGEATNIQKQYANVNSDSEVNIKDLVRFKKLEAEWKELEVREKCVYYVDADNGSDENDGLSADTAIRSLDKVNTLSLRAGDKVLFKRGCTWTCTADTPLLITHSGRDGRPITYGAYGTASSLPVINGAENVAETVRAVDVSHIIIDGIEIQNKTTEGTSNTEVYRRGIYVLAETKLVEDVVIQNCVVQNVRSNTELMSDGVSDDARWYGGIIVQGVGNYARGSILKNVHILNNTVAYNHNSGIAVGSKNSSSRKSIGVTVDSNRVIQNFGDGIIMFACDGEQVEGSKLNYSIMQRNVLDKNGTYGKKDRYFGGLWTIYSNNVLIQYNSVSNQCATGDGMGYDIDGACNNVIMQYNYSNNNEGGFLLLVNFRSGTAIVRNNVSVNDKMGFLKLWLHDAVTDYSGLSAEIYNNTYYTTENTKGLVWVDNSSAEGYNPIGTLTDKIHLRNNIFCYAGSYNSISTTADEDASGNYQGYFTFDYNCYDGIADVTAGGTNSITDSPMFVNPGADGADNYKLQAGSPCINTGTMINDNGSLDYWGNELDDTLNIGAYGVEP